MKEETKKNNILNIILFFIVLIIIFLFLCARYVGIKGLEVKEYRIVSENLPNNFSGIKIIHFSDLLLGNTTNIEDLEIIVDRINVLKPDLVIFTGDLLYKKISDKEINKIATLLNNIDVNLGKYAVKGDNDYNKYYDEIMKLTDFVILENNYDLIYKDGLTPIFLGGLSSLLKSSIDLDKVYEYYNNEDELYKATYKIILTHETDTIKKILKYDKSVDLILGGHSLNGSIVVPFYGPLILPKGSENYYLPNYKKNNTYIFISSGIGTEKYKYRLFNKPSFNFYRMKSL